MFCKNWKLQFNKDIKNNMSATASVVFPKLQGLFTGAMIYGNVTTNVGKE